MAHVLACARIPIRKLPKGIIPEKFFTALEQNQQLPTCCRHPENLDIEAWYSSEEWRDGKAGPEKNKGGQPDIYIIHCDAEHVYDTFDNEGKPMRVERKGARHIRKMVGNDIRPFWEVH